MAWCCVVGSPPIVASETIANELSPPSDEARSLCPTGVEWGTPSGLGPAGFGTLDGNKDHSV